MCPYRPLRTLTTKFPITRSVAGSSAVVAVLEVADTVAVVEVAADTVVAGGAVAGIVVVAVVDSNWDIVVVVDTVRAVA